MEISVSEDSVAVNLIDYRIKPKMIQYSRHFHKLSGVISSSVLSTRGESSQNRSIRKGGNYSKVEDYSNEFHHFSSDNTLNFSERTFSTRKYPPPSITAVSQTSLPSLKSTENRLLPPDRKRHHFESVYVKSGITSFNISTTTTTTLT